MNIKKITQLSLYALLAVTATPSSVLAADFVEGVNAPSLDNPANPFLGGLDSGVNTISGALAGTCAAADCNASSAVNGQDNFVFEIAAGSVLSGLGVTFSQTSGPANFQASFTLYDETYSTLYLFEPYIAAGSTFSAALNLGPGRYAANFYGQTADADGGFTVDYIHSLTVSPFRISAVPEPASWAMMIGGFGCVGGALRRRNTGSRAIA